MRPLTGTRVLDLTRLLPGGFCTSMLVDLGADVLKIEDTELGDYLRWSPPFYDQLPPSTQSAYFLALNHGKRSLRINLKKSKGRELFIELARDFDVLIESFRPGVLERLGLGYQQLAERNERLIYCSLTGTGQDSPLRARAGHDLNYLALSGLLWLNGEKDGPPITPAVQVGDIGGGALMAVIGIIAALYERERTKKGQFVDVSMLDGVTAWLSLTAAKYFCDGVLPQRGEPALSGGLICYRPYECKDGWITFAALEAKFWRQWCKGVNRPDLVDHQFDPVDSETHTQLKEIFLSKSRNAWEQFNDHYDCCVEPILDLDEVINSPHTQEREMITELIQTPNETVKQFAMPIKFERTEATIRRPAPKLGEHSEDVLKELGYNGESIQQLKEQKVIAGFDKKVGGEFIV